MKIFTDMFLRSLIRLLKLFAYLQQVISHLHRKPEKQWGMPRIVAPLIVQSNTTTERKIGLGVYQGDIVTIRRKASETHCWEVKELQSFELYRIHSEVLPKLCQAVCYIEHSLLSYQRRQGLQRSSGIKPQKPDCQNTAPDTIESSCEVGDNNALSQQTPKMQLAGIQDLRLPREPNLPNSADSYCGLYGRCKGCVNQMQTEPCLTPVLV